MVTLHNDSTSYPQHKLLTIETWNWGIKPILLILLYIIQGGYAQHFMDSTVLNLPFRIYIYVDNKRLYINFHFLLILVKISEEKYTTANGFKISK